MAKAYTSFVCQTCGYASPQWLGRCPECGTWNSLVETITEVAQSGRSPKAKSASKPQLLSTISKTKLNRIATGMSELDRTLGGGIVPGSVVLLAGDPGIGKSTLLLQLVTTVGGLYLAGEESADQIKLRATRLGLGVTKTAVLVGTDVDVAIENIYTAKPGLVIADSIQTLATNDLTSSAGSVGQIREAAARLIRAAKETSVPIFLIGHITKEGSIAGPKVLEHLVDTVLYLEGDEQHLFRILRVTKNRFGPTDEIGVFEMSERGMIEVFDPSAAFLAGRLEAPGSVVVPVIEGTRPILVEVQALTVSNNMGIPRRAALGVDHNRVQLLTAVLQKRAGLQLQNQDIFVNVTGGLKVTEPAIDLAVCLAIASATLGRPLKPGLTAIGEVGLLGEIRQVRSVDKRLKEARKRGFKIFITPNEVKTLRQAINLALAPSVENQ